MFSHIDEIRKVIPSDYHFFKDHMKPEGVPLKELSDDELNEYARRLVEVKKEKLMIGRLLTREEAVAMTPQAFYDEVLTTWKNLNYLHILA